MKRYQLGAAAFLLFVGAFVCWEARKLEYGRIVKPGPAFLPFWLGVALSFVSVVLILRMAREKTDRPVSSPGLWKGLRWEKVLYSLAALLLYGFFLESLGYILATFLLMVFFFRAIEPQRWFVAFFGAGVTSFITYALFKVWLQVQLPIGLWGI